VLSRLSRQHGLARSRNARIMGAVYSQRVGGRNAHPVGSTPMSVEAYERKRCAWTATNCARGSCTWPLARQAGISDWTGFPAESESTKDNHGSGAA
jgi:hypothetical protein